MEKNKSFGEEAIIQVTAGVQYGMFFIVIVQRIENWPTWTILITLLVLMLIYLLIPYFFFLSNIKNEEKIKFAEWEEAIKLAQTRDPRINNRMYDILRKEAIESFSNEDKVALDTHINEEIISKKADFILKVFKDLIPLYEEKEESHE